MLLKGKVPRDGTRRYLYDIWLPLAILITTFFFTLIFYTTYKAGSSTEPNAFFICNDNGYVEKTRHNYNPLWDPQLYFTINLASGQFAFSTVKVIDAAWDAVVGRGGQVVAALIAYRTLRRSLTLTMETCALAIPTVTSVYCQQIQVFPVMQMTHNLFQSWGDLNRPARRKTNFLGRLRLATQIFACVYVLLFATLVSVMTGYRAQLTGFVGSAAQSVRMSNLAVPRLVLLDGHRIGLPDSPVLALEEIPYPSNAETTSGFEAVFDAKEFIESTRNFQEPYGTLVDYYFTCEAVIQSFEFFDKTDPAYQLSCGAHNCSCSIPTHTPSGETNISYMNMTGRIVLNNASWEFMPLLALEVIPGGYSRKWNSFHDPTTVYSEFKNLSNAIDYWSGMSLTVNGIRDQGRFTSSYMHGDSFFNTTTILNGARCVVDDAYSWGFSSLLLLTFCFFTMLFALGLIILQTDVYWHSRHDRNHQSYSIYTDVLFLAEELKAAFGSEFEDHRRSPKLLCEQIEHMRKGIRLEVSTLPLPRSEEVTSDGKKRKTFRLDHRLESASYIKVALNRGQSTELEMVGQTPAASSAVDLQPEVVDTNDQGSRHGQ